MTVDAIGTGIAAPPQLDAHGDWAQVAGPAALAADIVTLLGIVPAGAGTAGELPWDGARGCALPQLRHRALHPEFTRAAAEQLVLGALARYEPRAQPLRVEAAADLTAGALTLRVIYAPVHGATTEQAVTLANL